MSTASIFRKIFGSKADRDAKRFRPAVAKTLEAYKSIDRLSDDELRARSAALKALIRERIAADEARVAEIADQMAGNLPAEEKEKLARESDKLVKVIDDKIEDSQAHCRQSSFPAPPFD